MTVIFPFARLDWDAAHLTRLGVEFPQNLPEGPFSADSGHGLGLIALTAVPPAIDRRDKSPSNRASGVGRGVSPRPGDPCDIASAAFKSP
jgi:hypothetical protein